MPGMFIRHFGAGGAMSLFVSEELQSGPDVRRVVQYFKSIPPSNPPPKVIKA